MAGPTGRSQISEVQRNTQTDEDAPERRRGVPLQPCLSIGRGSTPRGRFTLHRLPPNDRQLPQARLTARPLWRGVLSILETRNTESRIPAR